MLKTRLARIAIAALAAATLGAAAGVANAAPDTGTLALPTTPVDPNPNTNGTYVHHGVARNGCQQIGYIGDSLSDQTMGAWMNLTQGLNLYDFSYRLNASINRTITYAGTGSGKAAGSAADVARQYKAAGVDCYVLAIGTNDAAQTNGNYKEIIARIDTMMSIAGKAKVRWVMPQTMLKPGWIPTQFNPRFSDANMAVFRQAVLASAKKYPNLTVDRWDLVNKNIVGFWLPDNIHMLDGRFFFASYIISSILHTR
ncbi:hypothetical protein [Jongsikchunia kroppenstedtii]|uniref:hypothetical protein n=1 Tax=Jongsikchunia kroppenstedtii TaxID=1121721 RepID=UPI00036EF923|nr:hypothetical protein [Jongsikchunia kroppenstedtii]